MKTKEELTALKNEVEAMNKKLSELSEDELKAVTGGTAPSLPATELANGGYNGMFSGCENLKNAPDLPATTL